LLFKLVFDVQSILRKRDIFLFCDVISRYFDVDNQKIKKMRENIGQCITISFWLIFTYQNFKLE